MIETYVNTSIRCQPGAKRKVWNVAKEYGIIPTAWLFVCKKCGQRWNAPDFSGACEPDNVTCSSCYGNQVLIAQVRLQDIRTDLEREESC